MKQRYAIPRITTRGFYDLNSGRALGTRIDYGLYPKSKWDKIYAAKEITIFIHGMRNTRKGAIMGTRALTRKLRSLGYKHPVVSFTYDADVRGAGSKDDDKVIHATNTAFMIAKSNGYDNLFIFMNDLSVIKPQCKVNIVAHSMGCVVAETLLYKMFHRGKLGMIQSVHLLGSPVSTASLNALAMMGIEIVNYYNPRDEVIFEGVKKFGLFSPSCLVKSKILGITTRNAFAKDHRFKSYVATLRSFP